MKSGQDKTSNTANEITRQRSGSIKTEMDIVFRDLNKNGKLDIYEDPRQPVESRVEDLLGQMTLDEKVNMLHAKYMFVSAGVERLGIADMI